MVSQTTFGVHSPFYSISVCVCLLWASFLLASFQGRMGARVIPPTPVCKVPPPSSETYGTQSVPGNKIRLCSLVNRSPHKAKVEASSSIRPPPTSTKKVPPSPEAFCTYNGSSLQNQNHYYEGLKNTTGNVTSTQTPSGLP